MIMRVSVPADFRLLPTIFSHGWCSLPPFRVEKNREALELVVALSPNHLVNVSVTQSYRTVIINFDSSKKLGKADRQQVLATVRSCLRIDEDLSGFYDEAKRHARFRWVPKIKAGRLLRAPTVFEDVVKMICTTNCSWALTEIMVENLCSTLGDQYDGKYSFPTPEAIADRSEKFLRKEIRAGYRSPYLLELSRKIVKKEIDLESWRNSSLQTAELFSEIRSVKGIGPYAAGNILKLLGRYDYLGIDSLCRKRFFEIHKNGRTTSDKVIERFYEPFGTWRGLFFWMDITKSWYDRKFPL